MPRLSGIRLHVTNPAEIADFYVTELGMTVTRSGDHWRAGYDGDDADIVLLPGGPAYEHSRTDIYWKIGITLPNVDIAHAQLTAAGFAVTDPHQFHDIGYMCHLSDPAGFQIELLQHDFQANRPRSAGDQSLHLGGGARIGQITLRSGGDTPLPTAYADLGMTRLSVQRVTDMGFTLHFWAFGQETPPHHDPEAVENREWLWKRPYTTLEIQSVDGLTPTQTPNYAGIEVEGFDGTLNNRISAQNSVYFT